MKKHQSNKRVIIKDDQKDQKCFLTETQKANAKKETKEESKTTVVSGVSGIKLKSDKDISAHFDEL